jgi:hypothetical protein
LVICSIDVAFGIRFIVVIVFIIVDVVVFGCVDLLDLEEYGNVFLCLEESLEVLGELFSLEEGREIALKYETL